MNVYKTVLFTNVDFYQLDRAFREKANFEEIASSWQVPREIRDEIAHGHPRVRTHLASRVSRLMTQNYKAYRNGDDVVQMADFELVTNYNRYDDPILVITEAEKGRTSRLVKDDLLLNELKASVIESSVRKGMQHQDTRGFFEELAEMTNTSFDSIFNGTMDDLVVSMRESLDRQMEDMKRTMENPMQRMGMRDY